MRRKSASNRGPMWLIGLGVVGASLPLLHFRGGQPTTDVQDALRGLWTGLFLGLEVVGVTWLCKANARARRAGS